MARRRARIGAVSPQAATSNDVGISDGAVAVCEATRADVCSPHGFEQQVCFELESKHTFASLVVRRIPGGVCLQGVLDIDDGLPDVESLVRSIAGVERVLNQVVIVKRHEPINRIEAALQ